jgi:hypothetical protein
MGTFAVSDTFPFAHKQVERVSSGKFESLSTAVAAVANRTFIFSVDANDDESITALLAY